MIFIYVFTNASFMTLADNTGTLINRNSVQFHSNNKPTFGSICPILTLGRRDDEINSLGFHHILILSSYSSQQTSAINPIHSPAISLPEDMRVLWKIPIPPSCKRIASEVDETSTFLTESIGMSKRYVIDMYPAIFWKMYVRHFGDMSVPTESVVAIMGDLIRDRSDEKSLP